MQFLNIFEIKIVKYSSFLKLIFDVEKVNYATLLENKSFWLKLRNKINIFLPTGLMRPKISDFLLNGLVLANTEKKTNEIISFLS